MMNKSQQKRVQQRIIEQQSGGDCSCQMLDTSLSQVGESDCSCSECLEANLQAFNELKQLQQQMSRENSTRNFRPISTKRNENLRTRQATRIRQSTNKQTKKRLNQYRSLDGNDKIHRHKKQQANGQDKSQVEKRDEQELPQKFSSQCINEYVLVAKYRARQYFQQRKKLEKNQVQERLRLKQLIKQNLMALKYTAQAIRQQQQGEKVKQDYKWNHKPYHCKSRVECRKRLPYDPDLENKKEEIEEIKARIKKYKEETKEKPYQCPDKCPKHHLRTSKAKLDEIQKYIKEKAKKQQEKRNKQKLQKNKKQKIKQAKLRAIDIKCKEIMTKTKRYDPNISRTSFQNSIDHFSTFSELKQFKLQNMQQKQRKRKIRQEQKQKGGRLQQQMYENLSEQLIGDHPPIHSKIGTQSRYKKENQEAGQWCQKIVRDARIKPPKQIKKEDNFKKESKTHKATEKEKQRPLTTKTKGQSQKHLKKQEQKRMQLQRQIQRKKQQIYQEFQKRNSSAVTKQKFQSKNKAMRQQYEKNLKGPNPSNNQAYKIEKRNQYDYDPYRQVYKHQPTQDIKQLKAVGDPLMHEYEYQKNMGKYRELQIDQDREIFTKNGNNLRNKPTLKV